MSYESSRYPRREFLGQCAAVPLAASLAAAAEPMLSQGKQARVISLNVPRMPEADLAREVEELLKLVDPQLLYRREPVPAEKNAWPLWKQAGEVLVKEPEDDEFQDGVMKFLDYEPGLADNVRQRIVDWVRQNEECRKTIDQGIARGALEYPRSASSIRLSLAMDEISLVRSLARLKGRFCRVLVNRRDVGGALNEAASIIEMGRMLVRSECLLVDYLVAQAILGIGAHATYQAAIAPDASEVQAKAAVGDLAEATLTNEDLKRAYRVEVCRWFLPCIANISRTAGPMELATYHVAGEMSPDFKPSGKVLQEYQRSIRQIATLLEGHPNPFDKAATIRLGSQLYARLFHEMNAQWTKRDRNLSESLQKELSAWPAEVEPEMSVVLKFDTGQNTACKLTDVELKVARDALRKVANVFGKYIVQQMTSGTFGFDLVESNTARLEAKRLRLALRLYEKKRDHLPKHLDDLVIDKQLPGVPPDPYSGGRFKYSPENRVIWCVGPKGTNNGVVPEKHDRENPFLEDVELRWKIAKP